MGWILLESGRWVPFTVIETTADYLGIGTYIGSCTDSSAAGGQAIEESEVVDSLKSSYVNLLSDIARAGCGR